MFLTLFMPVFNVLSNDLNQSSNPALKYTNIFLILLKIRIIYHAEFFQGSTPFAENFTWRKCTGFFFVRISTLLYNGK